MGVAVSDWRLAKAVSRCGELGVVSGTGLAVVLARRLQSGDVGGHVRRAMDAFPLRHVAERVLQRYYCDGGKRPSVPFKSTPVPQVELSPAAVELTVLANFVEVYLAREGDDGIHGGPHGGLVGINYLEKIQTPTIPSLYGAMLAGVDYVLMGAGIPRQIPGILDLLAEGRAAELRLDVEGALPTDEPVVSRFDPAAFMGALLRPLKRPKFLAIVSSATLAMTLARKSNGKVDGFVVEGATAGGHNAPPRGPMQLSVKGEPVYGPRDAADLEKIREIGLPFYLAGGFGAPRRLPEALALGASGVQVGTAFAFCKESGIDPEIKAEVLQQAKAGTAEVFTDPLASPTGFPFKVVTVPGTLSEPDVYQARTTVCDLGYLRKIYRMEDGGIGYRCAAEPKEVFVSKGGKEEETVGRRCICNALFGTIGLGQVREDGSTEPAIVTAGDDVASLARYLHEGKMSYSARDVIEAIRGTSSGVRATVTEAERPVPEESPADATR
jgi:nitronate monooxygenase